MTTIIAIALFDLSVAAMLGVLWVTFSNHQYHTFQKMTAITYLIGSVSFLQAKEFQHEIIDPFPFWFVVIFAAANVWAVGFILHHYSIDNYVKKRINERLGGAMLISWRQLMNKRVDEKTFDFKVANAKKLSHNKGKYVFESFVERPTTDYYNDFYKDLLVIDGEVHVHFKTGEVEKLTNGKNAIIRPYEVHRLEPKQRSKLIVTCINPDI